MKNIKARPFGKCLTGATVTAERIALPFFTFVCAFTPISAKRAVRSAVLRIFAITRGLSAREHFVSPRTRSAALLTRCR